MLENLRSWMARNQNKSGSSLWIAKSLFSNCQLQASLPIWQTRKL